MKYYIIAGEASGDLHASNLMKSLSKEDENAEFRFWGGDLMQAVGGSMVKHYRETAFMGFLTVLKNLGKIKDNLKLCKSDILSFNPDVVILVDYPGFNLRIAEFAKLNNFRVHYYISPKIWAWKESRIKKIKKYVDRMFTIFPFETEFYNKHNYKVDFGGNPLLDAIENRKCKNQTRDEFLQKYQLPNKPIISLLAGSRKQEIDKILPLMVQVITSFPDYQFVLAAAPSIEPDLYNSICNSYDIKIIYNDTYSIVQNSHAAIVTSGTATLETALLNTPQIICYKTNGGKFLFTLGKFLLNIKYVSLVNLILDKMAVFELLQHFCTVENIKIELNKIIGSGSKRSEILEDYKKLRGILGGPGASDRFAKMIYKDLKDK
ncbi:MAG: lipid-A-disaccharide synthase [Marinifilaceae bacterium]|jgi:lipid-A-disaccharide synthase|nr:lipid-A-disaccharide synthase [Marinifilaceae bacterium]